MKVLLITPPFVQLNTPYPATSYLKGFLNTKGISSVQTDLGIEVVLKLFSHEGLHRVFNQINNESELSDNALRIFSLQDRYISTIDPVIRFLQGKNPDIAYAIDKGNYLPQASRFNDLDDLEWAFGNMGITDKAKHFCTLYLEDLADLIIETLDPHFGFSRYAERLGRSASSFDELEQELNGESSFIDQIMLQLLESQVDEVKPQLVAITIPFPGNVYSALRIGDWLKTNHPDIKVTLGGGYVNTELRQITDSRVFKYVDFISLDDGEAPLLNLVEFVAGGRSLNELKRTFILSENVVKYIDNSETKDIPQYQVGTPDYSGLPIDKYLSVIEIANPMHRLWSDGKWNKLTLAHGCYWGKCTFCDISLDYIGRYEPLTASLICDRIEDLISQTGHNGFHFVDEAAPPSLLKAVAIEILKRNLSVVWWTNIRFEKSFSNDLCKLLAAAGCIAVSGGLEVASDRLLELIKKGVTVEQVTRVADRFTKAGVMVHAYLMYGFPTQTEQETIDSLEVVRQLFLNHVIQSGFWHQFAMTTHSPVGLNPKEFQVEVSNPRVGSFANNDLEHKDPTGANHQQFSEGLRKSIYNYMHGLGLEFPLTDWFDFTVPNTIMDQNYISGILEVPDSIFPSEKSRLIWTGGPFRSTTKNGKWKFLFANLENQFNISLREDKAIWLKDIWPNFAPDSANMISYGELKKSYQNQFKEDFEPFWVSKEIQALRTNGLLAI